MADTVTLALSSPYACSLPLSLKAWHQPSAAPAIVKFVGGTAADAVSYTKEMMNITVSKDYSFTIPSLNFEGVPLGIDVVRVLETGILPIINTGIAHKKPGIGQIGAGITNPPMECFKKALKALAEKA